MVGPPIQFTICGPGYARRQAWQASGRHAGLVALGLCFSYVACIRAAAIKSGVAPWMLPILPPNGRVVSRDEDRSAADAAGVEVFEGFGRGVQRVGLGVQGDLAGLGERHQLGQVVVGADDVADDVPLGGNDVQRRDVHSARHWMPM